MLNTEWSAQLVMQEPEVLALFHGGCVNFKELMDTTRYYPGNSSVKPGVCIFQSPSGFAGNVTEGVLPELATGPLLLHLLTSQCATVSQSRPTASALKRSGSSMCLVHPALLCATPLHSNRSMSSRRKLLHGLSKLFYDIVIKLHNNMDTPVQNCTYHVGII